MPSEPVVGAAAAHDLLVGWRRSLQDESDKAAVAAPGSDLSTIPGLQR